MRCQACLSRHIGGSGFDVLFRARDRTALHPRLARRQRGRGVPTTSSGGSGARILLPRALLPAHVGMIRSLAAVASCVGLRFVNRGQPNLRRTRRLSRSKPMETTLARSVPALTNRVPAGLMVREVWLRVSPVRERLRCKFGHGTGPISHADDRRVGPR